MKLKRKVYLSLRERVLAGQLSPARLFTATIAREMQVSRTPVRDALHQLADEGLVDAHPEGGFVITRPSRQEVVELFELRQVLETYAALRAAERMTRKELAELRALCAEMRSVSQAVRVGRLTMLDGQLGERLEVSDARFHLLILRAAGNSLVLKTIRDQRIMTRVFGFRRHRLGQTLLASLEQGDQDHGLITQALADGDGALARDLMGQHIASGLDNLLANFDALAQEYSGAHPAVADWPEAVRRKIAAFELAEPPALRSVAEPRTPKRRAERKTVSRNGTGQSRRRSDSSEAL